MSEKRFKLIDGVKKGTHSGVWDNEKQHNQGTGDELWVGEVVDLLNEQHEEIQSVKKHIEELCDMLKVDVDNGIEVYPKTLMEYILNILKIIGDVE